MKLNSLLWKLVLAFMLVSVTTAGLVAVFIRMTNQDRLTRLIIDQQQSNLQAALADYYSQNGSWAHISRDWSQIHSQMFLPPPIPTNDRISRFAPPGSAIPLDRRHLFGLADAQGKVIIPVASGFPAGSVISPAALKSGVPVMVDGQRVGTILVANGQPRLSPNEALFLQHTNEALILAVIGAMLVALVIAFILARTLTSPLQALTQAAQNIALGKLDQQVKVTTHDEVGRLAEAFNQMS